MADSLPDIFLGSPPLSEEQPCSFDDEHVFINVSSDDNASNLPHSPAPPTLDARRFGPFIRFRILGLPLWTTVESFDVPPNVQSLTIVVSVDNPKYESIQLGRIELDTSHLQDLSLRGDNRFTGVLVHTNDTPLFISFACIYLPPDDKGLPNTGVPLRLLLDDNEEFHRLSNLGTYFSRKSSQSGDLADIDRSISYFKHALHLTPDGHINKPDCLNAIAVAFKCRFEYSRDLIDIENAISHLKNALCLTPDGHINKHHYLMNLAYSFKCRYQHAVHLRDFGMALSHVEDIQHFIPDGDTGKPGFLRNLGELFGDQFKHSGDPMDINKAISHYEHALHLTPDGHTDRPNCLGKLGSLFESRFRHFGDPMDIDKSISYLEHALHSIPDGHTDKPGYLDNLGFSLSHRYMVSGDLEDLGKSMSHHEHAVHLIPDGHADQPCFLRNLGNSFAYQFGHSRDLLDINKSISHYEHALRLTPDGHSDKPSSLMLLGISFGRRFRICGDLMDINKAISHLEHALHLTPDGHTGKPGSLDNLGYFLLRRFVVSGVLMDIDKSISYHEQAVHLIPDGHIQQPQFLNNLGNSFLGRFMHSKDLMDIDRAISHHEHALCLMSDANRTISHPKYGHCLMPDTDKFSCLSSLGTSFSYRFEQSGDLVDIDKSISHHEHVLHAIPDDHSSKPVYLHNLGTSLLRRGKHSRNPMDINKAIPHLEHALHLIPDDHADKPFYLARLGSSFIYQFKYSRDLVEIDKAISHLKHALDLIPESDYRRPDHLYSLGEAFIRRSIYSNNSTDLYQGIISFKDCATSVVGSTSILFQAALIWARVSYRVDPSLSLYGYETVLSFLPRVAWLGRSLSSRYKSLASMGDIAAEAASAAIDSGRPDIALEWLEQGRSIIWGQLLNLRTPLDDLRKVNPDLANDLEQTSRALEVASSYDTTSKDLVIPLSLEDAAQKHHRLAEKWEDLLKTIRMLPGFENFLLPRKVSALSRAAQSGPVVVINVHKSRSDALVLQAGQDNVLHIPLNSFYDKARKLQRSLSDGLRDARGIQIGHPKRFEKMLSSLWIDVVKPVLDGLAFNNPSTSELPRIWWCPTGPLTFLPIHTAGIYNQSSPGFNISDFFVSSYTPTVTALLEAVQETPKMYKGLLGVSQSATPGQSKLPNADKELDAIERFDSGSGIHRLMGDSATVSRVLKDMEDRSWVHLACHAIQRSDPPTESALHLHDGNLTLSKIITKSFPNADFAFLSACQTATGDEKLADEAVHLAAGMLAAGYRSVIATMWSIGDKDAPLIAEEVYRHLLGGPAPDSAMAAHALHHAVKKLRGKLEEDGTQNFLSWVPFIHVGK